MGVAVLCFLGVRFLCYFVKGFGVCDWYIVRWERMRDRGDMELFAYFFEGGVARDAWHDGVELRLN